MCHLLLVFALALPPLLQNYSPPGFVAEGCFVVVPAPRRRRHYYPHRSDPSSLSLSPTHRGSSGSRRGLSPRLQHRASPDADSTEETQCGTARDPIDDDDASPANNIRGSDDEDVSTANAASRSSVGEYSFFDEAVICVRAGSGGRGANTRVRRIAPGGRGGQDGPPDGGSGGRGGSVSLRADPSLNTLAGLSSPAARRPSAFGGGGGAAAASSYHSAGRPKSFRAENGGDGGRQFKNGRRGKDVVIRVPPGTVVQEQIKDESGAVTELIDLGTLSTDDEDTLIVATGGQGGEGSAVLGKSRGTRRPRLPATGGERKTLQLTLKIVADVALVGVPNAGKSTFLAAVTRAKPKIANYPFTTIIPNLGVWMPEEGQLKGAGSQGLVLCDVPGLIEGAARGVGLGHAFLRHVERCHVILHLIDATSEDPVGDYEMLNKEILMYGTGQLTKMPQVVVVNKVDAFDRAGTETDGLRAAFSREELEQRLRNIMPHGRLMWMSASERDGVDDLMTRLSAFVQKVKSVAKQEQEEVGK
jgi:GTP-binding protein